MIKLIKKLLKKSSYVIERNYLTQEYRIIKRDRFEPDQVLMVGFKTLEAAETRVLEYKHVDDLKKAWKKVK